MSIIALNPAVTLRRCRLLLAASVLATSAVSTGCGGGPRCGDGTPDPGEECDDGNNDDTDFCLSNCRTRPIPTLTILWSFNEDETRDFSGDTCFDMGVSEVVVELAGPTMLTETKQCSFNQAVFSDIPAGEYTVRLSPIDSDGDMKTNRPVEHTFSFSSGYLNEPVIVPYTAWEDSYTGSLFFRTAWAGEDCAAANPPVLEQQLTLEIGGDVSDRTTNLGDALDGSPSPCRTNESSARPQEVLDLPFGPATLTVAGLDGSGTHFEQTFDIFVGAGLNNPEYSFDIRSTDVDVDAGM
jgi:cysteine-rich repeat protein